MAAPPIPMAQMMMPQAAPVAINPELPLEHNLVVAVKLLNLALVTELLDGHEIDLNALSSEALVHTPPPFLPRVSHSMSNSGGILHILTSMRMQHPHVEPQVAQPILAKLLECGASPSGVDYSGFTPLHWACTHATDWAIRLLIGAGAPVNAVASDGGDTPLHCLFKTSPGQIAAAGAVQRLVTPLLDAGADATIRRADGLRPYDMVFEYARCGPHAVQAERDGLLAKVDVQSLTTVAGKLIVPGVGQLMLSGVDNYSAYSTTIRQIGRRQDRWPPAAIEELRQMARALDVRRRTFIASIRQLLLWRQRESSASGAAGGGHHPVCLLPEEVLFSIVLLSCGDAGVRSDWQRCFDDIGEHAAIENKYQQRLRALSKWAAQPAAHGPTAPKRDAAAAERERERDKRLQQLNDEYDEADAAAARLRRGEKKAAWVARPHARALRAVEVFLHAARPVLYGEDVEMDEATFPNCF